MSCCWSVCRSCSRCITPSAPTPSTTPRGVWSGFEFQADPAEPGISADAGQHLPLHVRLATARPRPRQIRRAVAAAAVPRAQDRQGADHLALGGADRARRRRLGMDVQFALQRHQLDHDRARRLQPRRGAELARHAASGDAVRDRRQRLAFLSVCDRRLPGRHHRGAAGHHRRRHRRRRRLLAPQLNHHADHSPDRRHRPDFRHRVYVHRPFRGLSLDQWRPGRRETRLDAQDVLMQKFRQGEP